jgi:hypothetical protein
VFLCIDYGTEYRVQQGNTSVFTGDLKTQYGLYYFAELNPIYFGMLMLFLVAMTLMTL